MSFGVGTETPLMYTCLGAPDGPHAQKGPCSELEISSTARLRNPALPIIPEARASEEYVVSSWHFSLQRRASTG